MQETIDSDEYDFPKKPVAYPLSVERLFKLGRETFSESPENLALWSILYLTGARICEIVGNKNTGRLGLQRQDLSNEKEEKLFRVRLLNEKNRLSMTRLVTIPCGDSSPTEREMLRDFVKYVRETKHPDTPIFYGISRQMAWNRISTAHANLEAIENRSTTNRKPIILYDQPINPHFLRHCRLTHLVETYGFDAGRLTLFAGWTSFRPAKTYVHLDWKALSKPFLEKEAKLNSQTQQINTSSSQVETSGAIPQ